MDKMKETIPWPNVYFVELLQDEQNTCVPQRHSMIGFRQFIHARDVFQVNILDRNKNTNFKSGTRRI